MRDVERHGRQTRKHGRVHKRQNAQNFTEAKTHPNHQGAQDIARKPQAPRPGTTEAPRTRRTPESQEPTGTNPRNSSENPKHRCKRRRDGSPEGQDRTRSCCVWHCTAWMARKNPSGTPICAKATNSQCRRVAHRTTLAGCKHFCIDHNPMDIRGPLTRSFGSNRSTQTNRASPNAVRECAHSRRHNPRRSFTSDCRPQGHASGRHMARQFWGGGRTDFVHSPAVSSIPAPNVAWELRLKPLVVVARAPLGGRTGPPANL